MPIEEKSDWMIQHHYYNYIKDQQNLDDYAQICVLYVGKSQSCEIFNTKEILNIKIIAGFDFNNN